MVSAIGALVESGFFDGCADEEASVAPGDEIDFGRTDDVFDQIARMHGEAEHLSFDRAGRDRMWANLRWTMRRRS